MAGSRCAYFFCGSAEHSILLWRAREREIQKQRRVYQIIFEFSKLLKSKTQFLITLMKMPFNFSIAGSVFYLLFLIPHISKEMISSYCCVDQPYDKNSPNLDLAKSQLNHSHDKKR